MKPLISSVRCEVLGNHCHVTLWNRGAACGRLVVNREDGIKIAKVLIPTGTESLDVTGGYQRWALAEASVTVGELTITATEDDEDPLNVRIADHKGPIGEVTWEGDCFGKFPFMLDLRESSHEAIVDLLAIRFAEAKRQLEAA